MAKPVVLPSRTFMTRSEAKDFCRTIHNITYAPGENVTDPDDFAVLMDLVRQHPTADEKIGPGIQDFFVQYTSYGDRAHVAHAQTGIWIRDIEGQERDFSYNTCIDQPDEMAVVKDALRNSIADLREAFREAAFTHTTVTCPRTGKVMTDWNEAALVYENPSWADLTSAFAATEGGWNQVVTDAGRGEVQIGRLLQDNGQTERWRQFWKSKAKTVLVSKDAL
jgi:hypothetical protein